MTKFNIENFFKKSGKAGSGSAGKKTWGQLVRFITKLQNIMKAENKDSKGKLQNKINEIKSDEPFFEYPIVYIPPVGELILVGDTHGDSESIRAILKQENFIAKAEAGKKVYLVVTGDYADRGKEDVQNIELLFMLKEKYPKLVYLLRGNHEEASMGQHYGLFGSCIEKFGYEKGQLVFQRLNDLFEKLPVVAVTGNGVVAVHGGVPISTINSLKELNDEDNLTDIRWNDPTEEIDHFVYNYRRGSNYLYGKKTFDSFMKGIGANVLFRSHEYVANGHKKLFNNKLVSIFSNGGDSKESGFADFILHPKYVKVDLSKPIKKWSDNNIIEIKY
ncbi:MAG: metallophosphoesterase family protein [Candidatus Kerfeldbacteria bacterium]